MDIWKRKAPFITISTLVLAAACGGPDEVSTATQPTTLAPEGIGDDSGTAEASTSAETEESDDGLPSLDETGEDTDPSIPPCAAGDGSCNMIDLLFVIDNSGTMGEEQLNLAANFPLLIERLQMLTNEEGEPLDPNVNIMVTTTDLGHPQCTPFQPETYSPAQGAPQDVACIERLDDFTGLGSGAASFPEACTVGCPVKVEPADAFIHFEGPPDMLTTNVPGNNITGALSCLGPQGINGCGFEAPLESMLQAINPGATWNLGAKPFLREGAVLAIAIITDEADCSVRPPDGYAFFTKQMQNTYWEINPETGTKTQATSAVCWNAGVDCGAPDQDGVYADCNAIDTGVLHPIDRYINYLQDELITEQNKEVIMLGILGVPPVTEHNPDPPYEPWAGGVEDLVYRTWQDADILPFEDDDVTPATKEFEFGVGPGCTGEDGMGAYTGQAVPPVRIKEVCESLNDGEEIRCCIESICDTDFSPALSCLTGLLQDVFVGVE